MANVTRTLSQAAFYVTDTGPGVPNNSDGSVVWMSYAES